MNNDLIAYRNANDRIQINSLNLQIALDDIFVLAKTEDELDYLEEHLTQHIIFARGEAEEILQEEGGN